MFLKSRQVARSAPSWLKTRERGPLGARLPCRISTPHFTYSAAVCITRPMRPAVNRSNLMNRKVDIFTTVWEPNVL